MALALGEDGDQHVCAGHFLAAGRLDVNHGALDHALETGGRLGFLPIGRGEGGEIIIDIERQRGLERGQIDIAGAHDRGRVGIVYQREQQVLERRILVPARIGVADCAMQGFFERTGK